MKLTGAAHWAGPTDRNKAHGNVGFATLPRCRVFRGWVRPKKRCPGAEHPLPGPVCVFGHSGVCWRRVVETR